MLKGLIALVAFAAPAADSPTSWWPASIDHVLIREETNSGGATSTQVVYWRANNPLILDATSGLRNGATVYTDTACLQAEADGHWCPCAPSRDPEHSLPKAPVSPGPTSMRRHWLLQLALGAYRDRPSSSRIWGLPDSPYEVVGEFKYDARGLPVEAYGRTRDGKGWARLQIFYRPPKPGELSVPFPWADEGRPVQTDSAGSCPGGGQGTPK